MELKAVQSSFKLFYSASFMRMQFILMLRFNPRHQQRIKELHALLKAAYTVPFRPFVHVSACWPSLLGA
jgi:hypothetical protein